MLYPENNFTLFWYWTYSWIINIEAGFVSFKLAFYEEFWYDLNYLAIGFLCLIFHIMDIIIRLNTVFYT